MAHGENASGGPTKAWYNPWVGKDHDVGWPDFDAWEPKKKRGRAAKAKAKRRRRNKIARKSRAANRGKA